MDRFPPRAQPVIVLVLALLASPSAQDQPPRFRTAVEVTSVDVTVVDDDGRPVPDLTRADFSVRIDGALGRVVNAEWVPLTRAAGDRAAEPVLPETFSSNVNAPPGRIILLAIDQQNIRFGGVTSIRGALFGFIDRLQPADRVGVVGIGPGGQVVPFTADREQVKQAVARMPGRKLPVRAGQHQIAVWEALAISRDDGELLRMVVLRECGTEPSNDPGSCAREVKSQADFMALNAVADGERTVSALRALFESLQRIDAPKTLMFVTEGFLLDDVKPSFVEIERLAAESRTTLYALRLDQRVQDPSQQSAYSPGSAGMDRMQLGQGLDQLANATRGRVFNVVTTPDAAFRSIEDELSGYYVLGVESDPSDRADRSRDISVEVARSGVTVRSRRRVLVNAAPRSARELVAAALASPLPARAVPVRTATFSLGGQDSGKVQLLIHADIGEGYSSGASMMMGYLLLAPDGRVVDSRGRQADLPPLMAGLPSPLQYNATASVEPGEYILRIAASDGDRVGSVEHTVRAALTVAGTTTLSDLIAGGPVYARESLQPTVTSSVSFGNLHAFVEAYGAGAPQTTVKYEVARTDDGPPLMSADALVRIAGAQRAIFTRLLSVRRLPPGAYILRAIVATGTGSGATLSPPRGAILSGDRGATLSGGCGATNSGGCGATLLGSLSLSAVVRRGFIIPPTAEAPFTPAELFLPVPEERLAGPFVPPDASVLGDELADVWRRVDALMRHRQFGAARDLLEQSVAKWPEDARFAKPLALLYATLGRAGDAVRMLQRHLAAQPADVDGLGLAVEWLYTLRMAGTVAYSASEDLQLARTYAGAYQQLNGPETPLVQVWLDYIEPVVAVVGRPF